MLLTKTEGLKYNDIVLLKCDYNQEGCFGIYEKEYRQYKHGLKRSIIKKDCCNNPKCMHEKRKESLLFTYGVDNIAHIEGVQEKRESTCIEKYGSKTPLSNKDIIDKGKITVLEKYGVENISQAEEIKNKKRESCIENFGVENATQSEEVKAKIQKTIIEKYGVKSYTQTEEYKNKVNKSNLKKYGVKWAGQSKQVIEKRMRTLRKNGNAPKSIQQKYLCTLLNGVLNYQINNCFVDILLKDNIVLEYDGGGHTMSVKVVI